MINILETSMPGEVNIATSGPSLELVNTSAYGRKVYREGDIAKVSIVSEDSYRNGGKAAIGGIVGGVFTGGIGLVLGAAFFGRRRQEGIYIAITHDGHNVVFKTNDKNVMTRMQIIAAKIDTNLSDSHKTLAPAALRQLPEGWKEPKESRAKGGAPVEKSEDRNKIRMEAPQVPLDPVMEAMLKQAKKLTDKN